MANLDVKLPNGAGWKTIGQLPLDGGGTAFGFQNGMICVMSYMEPSKGKRWHDGTTESQYHVAVSVKSELQVEGVAYKDGRRSPTGPELAKVREAFGMADATEDNHGDDTCRHLWMDIETEPDPEE